MSQTVDEEIDLTDITCNNSPPTLISIPKQGEKAVDNYKQEYVLTHIPMIMVTHTLYGIIVTG
jgi:hypothetical protein